MMFKEWDEIEALWIGDGFWFEGIIFVKKFLWEERFNEKLTCEIIENPI